MASEGDLIEVLKPVAEPGVPPRRLAPRREALQGLTVGFLYNLKFNADRLIDRFSSRLREGYGVAATPVLSKHSDSLPAHPEVIRAMARQADCVVTLLGD